MSVVAEGSAIYVPVDVQPPGGVGDKLEYNHLQLSIVTTAAANLYGVIFRVISARGCHAVRRGPAPVTGNQRYRSA